MSRILVRACQKLGCAAAILCLVHLAAAQASTRFAGSYQLSGISEDSSQVQLTVTLTLINPEHTDVKGGIVALMDSTPGAGLIGSFTAIKSLPAFGHATVSHAFTISAAEYARWQEGHAPRFQFLLQDGDKAVAADVQVHQATLPAKAAN